MTSYCRKNWKSQRCKVDEAKIMSYFVKNRTVYARMTSKWCNGESDEVQAEASQGLRENNRLLAKNLQSRRKNDELPQQNSKDLSKSV